LLYKLYILIIIQFFRATRSLTSTYSTVVNFSMKDINNRLKRIEAITTIKTELESSNTGIQFTRQKQNNNLNSEISMVWTILQL